MLRRTSEGKKSPGDAGQITVAEATAVSVLSDPVFPFPA